MSNGSERKIVIVGAGIIGCTTAYYLTRHPLYSSGSCNITLLEASKHGQAQGASGKAGGLIAKWAYPRNLVAASFPEHERLAEEHDGASRWGWRYLRVGSWEGRGQPTVLKDSDQATIKEKKSLEKVLGLDGGKPKGRRKAVLPDDLNWVPEDLTDSYSPMAGDGETAQVYPYLFTTSMLDLAKEKGATLVQGKATSINKTEGRVTGVTYITSSGAEETLPATEVVLCAGAWCTTLIPTLPLSGTRAHSLTISPSDGTKIAGYALFTEIGIPGLEDDVHPEIYPRPNNEVYACGHGDNPPLPPTVDDVVKDEAALDTLLEHVSSISPVLRDGKVNRRQACILPTVDAGGGPIIGAADKVAKGVYIATGHTCWVGFSLQALNRTSV